MRRAIVVILIVSMSLNVVVGWAIGDESIDFESEQPIQIEDIMESSEDIKTEESDEPNIEDELDEQDVVEELNVEEENIDSDELDVEDKTIIEEENIESENQETLEDAKEQTEETEEQEVIEEQEETIEDIQDEKEFIEVEEVTVIEEIEQPVTTFITEIITITEGSYRIGGNNVNFDTSNTQPFTTEFNISPSKGGFISTPVNIRNTGSTELIIKAKSCVSIGSNTPRVVDPNKFRDWLSLGRKETARNIALGLQVKNNKYWFNEEGNQRTEEIYILQPNESINIELISKHGMSWTGTPTLKYNCLLEIEAIPTQKEITIEVAIEDNEQSVIEEITE